MNGFTEKDQRAKAEVLRRLHHDPTILILVNVWDVASAQVVAATPGCSAIATASAAIAAAHGYADGENIPLDLVLAGVERISRAVDLPVTADLERGYDNVRTTTAAALQAGAVGINLEDNMTPAENMEARIRDAVDTGGEYRIPHVVNARTDVYLMRSEWTPERRLAEAAERGRRYLDAGADCVFVPGCTNTSHIRDLVSRFGQGRLSLLASPGIANAGDLERWGVARLSHGPYPHQHTMDALSAYARQHTIPPSLDPRRGGETPDDPPPVGE